MKPYLAAVVTLLVTLVVLTGLVTLRPSTPAAPDSPTSPRPPSGPEGVLAVKIDNVRAARPSTGVGAADVVYVEPVEAGLTRLAAFYSAQRPTVVGPVRSARLTDVQLLASLPHPNLAFSGAAPSVLERLRTAPLQTVSPAHAPGAYARDPRRPVPHNLYLHPSRLESRASGRHYELAPTGRAPDGGAARSRQRVRYPEASFEFSWSPKPGRWLISMDGRPLTDTAAGRLVASTVVVQRVGTRPPPARDSAMAPTALTVGHGPALVLRDGRSYRASWSRPDPGAPTAFTGQDGRPLPFARGQTWVLLVTAPLPTSAPTR